MERTAPGNKGYLMRKVSKAVAVCLGANAIGLTAYLFFCWRLWVDEPDGMIRSDDGPTAISWFFTAFPFMVICAAVDFVLLVLVIRSIFGKIRWGLAVSLCLVGCAWLAGVIHGQGHIAG
jgi:hypothetical protein